ncbi:CHASE domain-containing protein [Shewanella aestuarii]|uniref:CHASE domain-containing protein n=1 Tax=Shewanella aestuarii TaxID=1028752 RepID=A0A6G9QNU4_9GAMM|nr:CHASE domain-containing protein [Shewanella aestuarii]QIR15509.1 hypothetical protein HBH39_14250 [Shewanella aestuarii]
MSEIVHTQTQAIERRLGQSLSSTKILAQEVRQNRGLFPDFEEYAQEVMDTVGGISNLQLAPNGIIHSIHPIDGNEKAIGHDILKDDSRRKEALLALHEQHMTLAGPFELIQGEWRWLDETPSF